MERDSPVGLLAIAIISKIAKAFKFIAVKNKIACIYSPFNIFKFLLLFIITQ